MALPDRQTQAVIAVNRFGLGARPGEIADAMADPRGWVLEQLGGAPPTSVADAGLLPSSRDALNTYNKLIAIRVQQKRAGAAAANASMGGDMGASGPGDYSRATYLAEMTSRVRTAMTTSAPVLERLVWFWSNHFTVSTSQPAVGPIAGAFEREAIRPHVLGRFEDMLMSVTLHPAMMLYLDQQRSFGPNSERGKRQGLGLNENLGREVLELHTLGVDGGYTQQDVTVFAKALTGWTVGGEKRTEAGDGEAVYVAMIHEPGDKTILGKSYADTGKDQAVDALRDFARHPATARHVAVKLARHFIADDPPEDAVDTLARTFNDTGGDLRAMARAAMTLDAAWDGAQRKVKTPNEFVVSTLRGLGDGAASGQAVLTSLNTLGQRPYWAPSPAGWPDTANGWAGPDALYRRIEWASATGKRLAPSVERPADAARTMLGAQASDRLMEGIARAESKAQAIALILSSPEFQRR